MREKARDNIWNERYLLLVIEEVLSAKEDHVIKSVHVLTADNLVAQLLWKNLKEKMSEMLVGHILRVLRSGLEPLTNMDVQILERFATWKGVKTADALHLALDGPALMEAVQMAPEFEAIVLHSAGHGAASWVNSVRHHGPEECPKHT